MTEAREILPLRRTTRLPGAPPFVRGLLNVRGSIVTILDLGARLDPSRAPATRGSILLVRWHDRSVGVVVDQVVDVRLLDDAGDFEGTHGPLVRRMARLDDATPVAIVDFDALISQVLLS